MKRLATLVLLLVLPSVNAVAGPPANNLSPSKLSWKILADVQVTVNDGHASWLQQGAGKFRFDETDNDQLRTGILGAAINYKTSRVSKFQTVLQYNHDPDQDVIITEAFWHYRPVPKSAWRPEYKVGAFHAPFSLENSGSLWSSPFSLSPSVANSWFGEELRTIGAETTWQWRKSPRSPHRLNLTAGVFMGNDTAGLLLAWRGWSNTDRQTGLGERLALRNLPNFADGRAFEEQTPWAEPFVEIDNRPGFYVGADWSYQRRLKVALHHYDNQAQTTALEDGQYGWRTEFTQLSASWQLAANTRLLSQYMKGSTQMNNTLLQNDFATGYVLLSQRIGNHNFTGRWETFSVDDRDATPMDNNWDDGYSITLAYAYRFPKNWKLSVEAIRHQSDRLGRRYFNEPEKITEDRLVFSVRYYL